MRASALGVPLPTVDRATTAVAAARLIANEGLAALVIADKSGSPVAVVSSTDVLSLMVPGYILDDMSLAGVLDEVGAGEMWTHADRRTIGEILDDDRVRVHDIVRIDGDATLVEMAAVMVDSRAQLAFVKGSDQDPSFVTLPAVMDAILIACGEDGAGS